MSENLIGLPRDIVRLSLYSKRWVKIYKDEEKLLHEALGGIALDIQHVGSTSIPGLISKPVIDIAVAVKTFSDCDKCIGPLIELGYHYRHGAGVKGGYHFAKGPESNRTHYVHVEELFGKMWYDHILFRNYLRAHSEAMEKYAELKIQLAEKFPADRPAYLEGKSGFITEVVEKARIEYEIKDLLDI
ncbi:MAG: GrpB family protein [Ignavibacteriae bacterium]|nr:MAG: GrpB family protein [Ignavibacteriota bacterium]